MENKPITQLEWEHQMQVLKHQELEQTHQLRQEIDEIHAQMNALREKRASLERRIEEIKSAGNATSQEITAQYLVKVKALRENQTEEDNVR